MDASITNCISAVHPSVEVIGSTGIIGSTFGIITSLVVVGGTVGVVGGAVGGRVGEVVGTVGASGIFEQISSMSFALNFPIAVNRLVFHTRLASP